MKENITYYRSMIAHMKYAKREKDERIVNRLRRLGFEIPLIADIMEMKESTVRNIIRKHEKEGV